MTPVVLRAKLLMQKLWQLKITWDEPLNKDIQAEWKEIAINLKKASQFSVSQCYINAPLTHLVIHCFADASQSAHGAEVFFTKDDQVSFVTAKARVAPLKMLTIPQLKLMAAMVGTHLTNFVIT